MSLTLKCAQNMFYWMRMFLFKEFLFSVKISGAFSLGKVDTSIKIHIRRISVGWPEDFFLNWQQVIPKKNSAWSSNETGVKYESAINIKSINKNIYLTAVPIIFFTFFCLSGHLLAYWFFKKIWWWWGWRDNAYGFLVNLFLLEIRVLLCRLQVKCKGQVTTSVTVSNLN